MCNLPSTKFFMLIMFFLSLFGCSFPMNPPCSNVSSDKLVFEDGTINEGRTKKITLTNPTKKYRKYTMRICLCNIEHSSHTVLRDSIILLIRSYMDCYGQEKILHDTLPITIAGEGCRSGHFNVFLAPDQEMSFDVGVDLNAQPLFTNDVGVISVEWLLEKEADKEEFLEMINFKKAAPL